MLKTVQNVVHTLLSTEYSTRTSTGTYRYRVLVPYDVLYSSTSTVIVILQKVSVLTYEYLKQFSNNQGYLYDVTMAPDDGLDR